MDQASSRRGAEVPEITFRRHRAASLFVPFGMNTEANSNNPNNSYYSGLGYIWQNRLGIAATSTATQVQAAMDARQTMLCNNMKAQELVIYTVQFDTPRTAPAALSGCATTAANFYNVQDVSTLPAAFSAIAGSIGHLRISQ